MVQQGRRPKGLYRPVQFGADLVSLVAALLLAYVIRTQLPTFSDAHDLSSNLASGLWVLVFGWVVAIAFHGGYNPRLLSTGSQLYSAITHATIYAAGFTGVILYLTGIPLSRVFFAVFFVLGPFFLLLNRLILRRVLNGLRSRGKWLMPTILVGSLPQVDAIGRTLKREGWLGYSIIGAISPEGDPRRHSRLGIEVLGSDGDLIDIVRERRPAILIFTAGSSFQGAEMRRLAWELGDFNVDMIVVPAISEIASDRVMMRPVAGLPLVHLDPPRAREALRWSKRAFDIVASAVGLVVTSPLLLVTAAVVKLADGGPVFFVHKRVGQGGKHFDFYKFRSMVPNAEEIRAAELEGAERDKGNAVMFKMADDPRITKPGRILRRYSIDELPQLWNVLKGDMSLIGPRPALPSEVRAYDADALHRLSVRPGITGLWQVSGRSDLSWDETVRLDLYYVDNWSFTQDISILTRTVRAVLASDGAY
ncbi:MAG: sugar transferase [Dermabacter sp.]|nr:sugar transferase [Dermabacter sp.]